MDQITLTPGKYPVTRHDGTPYELSINKDVESEPGSVWDWQVDGQFFSRADWADEYLQKRIQELETGKRHFNRPPGSYPVICGIKGAACRLRHREDGSPMYSMLCSNCPKADEMQTEKDGLILVYEPVSNGGETDA